MLHPRSGTAYAFPSNIKRGEPSSNMTMLKMLQGDVNYNGQSKLLRTVHGFRENLFGSSIIRRRIIPKATSPADKSEWHRCRHALHRPPKGELPIHFGRCRM